MPKRAETYRHDEEALLRPEVGTQAQFKKRKPPKTYRYDSSLSPALDWDGQNPARELGEWLLAQIEEAAALEPPHRFSEPRRFGDVEVAGLADAVDQLKRARPAVPRLGRQGRAALVRRADAAALRPRAALDEGDPRDARRPRARPADGDAALRRPAAPAPPAARGLRAQGRLGQPDDPRRLARRHELAARVRGPRRAGADDLHRPALRREVRLELPAVRAQARRQGRRRRTT